MTVPLGWTGYAVSAATASGGIGAPELSLMAVLGIVEVAELVDASI